MLPRIQIFRQSLDVSLLSYCLPVFVHRQVFFAAPSIPNKEIMFATTVTIPTLNGESVDLDVNSIQFFWQKLGHKYNPFITQIVCNNAKDSTEVDSCIYLAGSALPAIETFNDSSPFLSGRFIVETQTTLSDLHKQISDTTSVKNFLVFRRLYTCEDNRVFAPCPSKFINDLLKHFVHVPNDAPQRTSHWECNVGGGGGVHDCPTWWLHTHHGFGIVSSSNAHDILAALHHMDESIPVPGPDERLAILPTVPVKQ